MITTNRKLINWLYSGCFLIFIMVVVGGITRLTGSGLSITEWNVITGTIPPLTDEQWAEEFNKYQQSPQFQQINTHFELSNFKNIYWWEYIHRLVGRLLGIVFLVPFVYFLIKKQIRKDLLPKLILIFALGAWQGFLGWYMVKSGLLNEPYVSHFRLAIHLVNAFLTFGYIYWVILDLKFGSKRMKEQNLRQAISISVVTFILVVIQLIYGGFVAGLHAGHIYNTWPMMGNEWIASSVIAAYQNMGIMSLLSDISCVQFIHRTVGLLIFILIALMWGMRNKAQWNLKSKQKYAINLAMGFVSIQVLLGIFTLIFNVPIWLGVIHQIGAFMLFAGIIFQIHCLKKG